MAVKPKNRVPVGSKFGRYEVVKHLARGGMADLSIARASGIEGFERHVVLKHLRPEESEDATFVQMFATEARLAASLHHHNIVQVHDIGQEAGRHYFAMEYIHGEDLRRMLHQLKQREQQMPIEHVVTIGIAVASALHHAHEQRGSDRKPLGMVHRDITPGNIIIGYDGNVKVVDFGIAKAAHRKGDAITQAGMLKGKVPYMSPEQCSGKPVDRRSDLFSLGIVLYEMSTVRRLFKGGNEFSTMSAVINGDIPSPSEVRADLPGRLETIILKALTRDIEHRYQSAEEIRVALDEFADKAGLRTSVSALATFMKQLFGDRAEPWLDDGEQAKLVDFDSNNAGLVATPADLPKSRAPSGSLLEQARREVTAKAAIVTVVDPTDQIRVEKTVVDKRSPFVEKTVVDKSPFAESTTEVEVKTDVQTPPPPPAVTPTSQIAVAAAVPEAVVNDATAVVRPLAYQEDTASIRRAKPRGNTWLVGGGIAAVAVIIAVVIAVSTGNNAAALDQKPEARPTTPPVAVEPPMPTPTAEPPMPAPAPTPTPTPDPVPEVDPPPTVAVTPDPPKPDPKVDPPKPAAHKPPVVVTQKPKPKPRPKPPVAPKPEPKWDPNALFLKK